MFLAFLSRQSMIKKMALLYHLKAVIFFLVFSFQGNKFYIELYGGNVVVTKRLDYESINNYTLKIVAKVGATPRFWLKKQLIYLLLS